MGTRQGELRPVPGRLEGYVGPKVLAVFCDRAPVLADLCDGHPCGRLGLQRDLPRRVERLLEFNLWDVGEYLREELYR